MAFIFMGDEKNGTMVLQHKNGQKHTVKHHQENKKRGRVKVKEEGGATHHINLEMDLNQLVKLARPG